MNGEKRSAPKAGIFDLRNVIGLLLAIYGVVLVLAGLFGTSAAAVRKSVGVNANVWAGVVMLVMAAVFIGWAWLRPTVVREHPAEPERPAAPEER